jgi:hypothetical protein
VYQLVRVLWMPVDMVLQLQLLGCSVEVSLLMGFAGSMQFIVKRRLLDISTLCRVLVVIEVDS